MISVGCPTDGYFPHSSRRRFRQLRGSEQESSQEGIRLGRNVVERRIRAFIGRERLAAKSLIAGRSRRGAPMLNTQINQTNNSVQIDTVENILVGGVVRGRVECRSMHPHCATGKSKPGMAELSEYASSPWRAGSSFEPPAADAPAAKAAALSARSATAARQMPAPAWGRLVVLTALSS